MPTGGGEITLPLIGLAAGIGACLIAFVIPRMLRRIATAKFKASKQEEDSEVSPESALTGNQNQLVKSSQAATLIGQAVLEGAAMMNLVLFLIDPNAVFVGVALICLVGIVVQVPTASKLQQCIENAIGQE